MHHHAYLCIGTQTWAFEHFPFVYEEHNPDHEVRTYTRMSIDDVRLLREYALYAPQRGSSRILFISAQSIPVEAQNALLKLFEEPHEQLVFCVCVPHEHVCIPTLTSRFHLVGIEPVGIDMEPFALFSQLSIAERLASVEKHIDADDREWMRSLVDGYCTRMREERSCVGMRDALFIQRAFDFPGSSRKMLLSHIAIAL